MDYKKAYKKYHSSKKAKTERAMRNAAGRIMKKLGKKKAGYEVDHIIPISKGGTNDQDNLRMIPKSINRKLGQGITTSIRREKDVYEGKKKKLSKKQLKIAQAAPPPDEITGADFAALRAKKDKKIDEFVSQIDERKRKRKIRKYATPGEKSYRAKNYGGGKKRLKDFERAAHEYRKGNVKKAAAIRQRMEKKHMAESSKLDRNTLKEMIEEILQFEMLENFMIEMDVLEDVDELMLNERKKRRKRRKSKKKAKSKGGGLSAAVKKSLDKKADRRCLTRGSVYSEFRKGLAAFLSSGSRKGMSAHQWAHARVNSANPSKSWASVKKRKKCPKKKKK